MIRKARSAAVVLATAGATHVGTRAYLDPGPEAGPAPAVVATAAPVASSTAPVPPATADAPAVVAGRSFGRALLAAEAVRWERWADAVERGAPGPGPSRDAAAPVAAEVSPYDRIVAPALGPSFPDGPVPVGDPRRRRLAAFGRALASGLRPAPTTDTP